MRSKNNLKKFGHVAKNSSQRQAYQSMIYGQQRRGSTTEDRLETDFEETASVDGTIVDAEIIDDKKATKPFSSFKTQIREQWGGIILTVLVAVFVPLVSWLFLEVIGNSKSIAVQETRINNLDTNISKLDEDFSVVRDRSLQSETLLKSLEKYVSRMIVGN